MSVKDRIGNLAGTAKWKANQELRIYKLNSQVSECETIIRSTKSRLADTAYSLFEKDNLANPELAQICEIIKSSYNNIENLKKEIEAVKIEPPPDQIYNVDPLMGLLVCPVDGEPLKAKFCPKHGVDGVMQGEYNPSKTASASGFQCPDCGRILEGEFCPIHGKKGVPVPSSVGTIDEVKQQIKHCPECGIELQGNYCPVHGKEGV